MSRTAKLNIGSVTMPAGDYWVGDPCYAFEDHGRWMAWLEAAGYLDNPRYLIADVMTPAGAFPVIGVGTAHGDGEYAGSDGNSYPVDAGLIGAVPVEVSDVDAPFGMQRVTFPVPFEVAYDDGDITVGDIVISTDRWADDEDEDDEYGLDFVEDAFGEELE